MLLNIVAITRQLQLTGNIPFSVKSGERKEKIDYLNRKLTSYFEKNNKFNKHSVEKRSNEIPEIVYDLLTE
jgi:hypothetical protein